MATLTDRKIKDTYKQQLRIDNPAGLDGTLRNVESGDGVVSPIQLATSELKFTKPLTLEIGTNTLKGLVIKGAASQSANHLEIRNSADTLLLGINAAGTLVGDSSVLASCLNALLPTQTGQGGKVLGTDGASTSWTSISPGGSSGQLQFNSAGAFGGTTRITYSSSGTILDITSSATTDIPLSVQSVASQTAPVFYARNYLGHGKVLIHAASTGYLRIHDDVNSTSTSFFDIYNGFVPLFRAGNLTASPTLFYLASGYTLTLVGDTWDASRTISVLITTPSATTCPLVIKGAASQSANYLEIRNSADTLLLGINSAGALSSGNVESVVITSTNTAGIPLVVRGPNSHTANLQEWYRSSGTAVGALSSTGSFTVFRLTGPTTTHSIDFAVNLSSNGPLYILASHGTSFDVGTFTNTEFRLIQNNIARLRFLLDGTTYVTGFASSATGIIIKGPASHTSYLQLWRTSADVDVVTINSEGRIAQLAGTGSSYAKFGGTIFDNFTDASNTGASETDLYSSSVPANTLSSNGDKLTGKYGGTFAATINSKQLKVYFAGTVILDTGSLAITTLNSWSIDLLIVRVSSSTARVICTFNSSSTVLASLVTQTDLSSLNFTVANTLKITGTATDNADLTAKLASIDWKAAA